MSPNSQSQTTLLAPPGVAKRDTTTFDPLLRGLELPFSQLYHPYGFPLRVSSNSSAVIDAARRSFGHFRREPADLQAEPEVELEVMMTGDENGPAAPSGTTIRNRRHLMTISGDVEHFGSCDFRSGFANLYLSPRILRDPAVLRYYFLETLGFCMIAERHLAPVHASCVALNGSAVLLCGPSTAGKSSLAYACARRGFTYISDDGSYMVRKAADRIVRGNPRFIRFRTSACELFPELSEIPAIRRGNGKMSIEVQTSTLGLTTADSCRIDHMVFLNRRPSGPASLRSIPGDEALADMEVSLAYGRESSIAEQRASLMRLMALGIQELTYSSLDSAIDVLESLLTRRGA